MVERHIMLARAAKMRREPTEAEKRLWRHLSGAKLSGLKFRRQATIGGRIADFFCPSKGLIVEIDGMTHDRAGDLVIDGRMEAQYGYTTIRVTNDDVIKNMDGVLRQIEITALGLQNRWPHPNPFLQGEGL